jgi:Transposase DDE domain
VPPIVPKPLTSGARRMAGSASKISSTIRARTSTIVPVARRDLAILGCRGGLKAALLLDDEMHRLRAEIEMHAAKQRRVKRWEHEAVLDTMQERLDRALKTVRIRRQTAEHPFGTIKTWIGATHFRLRALEKVRTDLSLHFLAYNLKRMIVILGVQPTHPGGEARLSPPTCENLSLPKIAFSHGLGGFRRHAGNASSPPHSRRSRPCVSTQLD